MDTPKLKPANENPWYILMTLHGEITADMSAEEASALNDRNAESWNLFVCYGMSNETIAELEVLTGLSLPSHERCSSMLTTLHRLFRVAEKERGSGEFSQLPDINSRFDLSYLTFDHKTDLSKRVFRKLTFVGSEFHEDAHFDQSVFARSVDFTRATFAKKTFFLHAHFAGNAIFRGRFTGEITNQTDNAASFGELTFFSGCWFKRRADFYGRIMGKPSPQFSAISFANTVFEGPVAFEDAWFPHSMPTLSNTTFPSSTKVTVEPELWPKLVFSDGETDVEGIKASAATLRHAMGRQNLPEEEHFFFRREMWAAARSGPVLARPLIWFYGAVSNYGYSIGRPALLLTALWLAGWAVFTGQETRSDNGVLETLGSWEAAFFSFANMFKFFGLLGTYFNGVAADFSEQMQVAAGGQTVVAFILLFFLGLGLRTRFRLR